MTEAAGDGFAKYMIEHGLPENPLTKRGVPPMTDPVAVRKIRKALSAASVAALMLEYEARLYEERQEPGKAKPLRGQAEELRRTVADAEETLKGGLDR